jgi:carbon-monoxide dehydrogenase small subunit
MTMKTVTMTVNGQAVTAEVEPRTHLADFLREQRLLTGTHLGCEQGVCGACTVEIDGQIARSCITYAVACDGVKLRSIEGFDDEPLMAELRRAFSAEHALQCGYCTPGMLIAARDIVTRLPEADDARVRVELSGNLCRCTGYVGIVKAIRRVLDGRRGGAALPAAPAAQVAPAPAAPAPLAVPAEPPATPPARQVGEATGDLTTLRQSFTVHHPRGRVWAYFGDVARVASCMPGAAVTEATETHVAGRINIKLGPIGAAFEGEAEIERNGGAYRGVIRGGGRDRRSATRAKGEVTYSLAEDEGGAATRVDVSVAFSLAGPLAQFGRGGIVEDLAARITAEFAKNLEARLGGGEDAAPATAAEIEAGSLLFSVLWARVKGVFARLLGRS